MQLHRLEPHLHAMPLGVWRDLAISGKQRELSVALSRFIKCFDDPTPSFVLTVIDFAEIQHLALHHLAGRAALVLDNIPVSMFFAVFEASVGSQEHVGGIAKS
jgi:hypothetical protein